MYIGARALLKNFMVKVIILLYNRLIQLIGKNTFDAVFVTGALFGVGFFSYLLQLLLGRLLTVEGFGDFTALLSFVTIITFFSNVVGMALVKLFSELHAENKNSELVNLFKKVILLSTFAGIVLTFALILFQNQIHMYLNISYQNVIIFFALDFILTFPLMYVATLLQATNRFIYFSFYTVLGSMLRLVFPVLLLVFISKDPSFVFLGFLLSQILSIVIALVVIKLSKVLVTFEKAVCVHVKSREHIQKLLSDIIPIAAITGVMALLSNYDMILVKHYFNAFNAGIYAGTLTLGKIILFGAGSVATVMYPRVVSNKKNKVAVLRLVKQFTLIQVVFILIPLSCYILIPSLITTLLFGEKYISSIPFLPIYAVFIGFWVLINYILTLLIALDERKIALFVPAFFVAQFLGISTFHNSLYQVVWINFGVGLAFALFTSGYFIKVLRKL